MQIDLLVRDDVVVLAGDLDVRSTAVVRRAIHESLARHGRCVVELAAVENVDVVALKMLAAASWVAAHDGREMRLRDPGPAVRRLLRLTHLRRLVEVDRVAQPA